MNPISKLFASNHYNMMRGVNSDVQKFVKEPSLLAMYEGDTVTLGDTKSSEKFEDVFKEMRLNVPDRTSTIEEKVLALSYIDRMLACDDISPDLKTYWQNKKEVIEMEMQCIKNEQTNGQEENINDVLKEFNEFVNKYFKDFDNNLSVDDKKENKLTYYRAYIGLCNRMLACPDIANDQRAEVFMMMSNAYRDVFNWEKM